MKIRQGTKLYIATPCYGGQLHVAYAHSLLQTQAYLNHNGIESYHAFIPGDSLVTRARNVLVSQFMAGPYTHMLFIDADIQFEPESVARLLTATMADDVEIACGIYPKKCLPAEFPVNFLQGAGGAVVQHTEIGYVEIKDAPTGFLMMRRDAIQRMMDAYPERKCSLRQEAPEAERQYEYALFDCLIDTDGRYLSEDFAFSRLWQRIGGRVWMDPDIKLIHHGHYAYSASVQNLFVPKDVVRPDSPEAIQGWMTPAELQWLYATASRMDSVVEIGSWKGRSTFALCQACPGPVYAVDHWLGSESERNGPHLEAQTGDVFGQFLRNVGHFQNLRVIRKDSAIAAKELPEADMVFIDAEHTYDAVVRDIRAWRGKARRLICGHDADWAPVLQAVIDELGNVGRGPGSIWFKGIAA